MAESILKLFEQSPPSRFLVCGKGPSLDAFVRNPILGTPFSVWAINDAVFAMADCLPKKEHFFWSWQDERYSRMKAPAGCVQVTRPGYDIPEGGYEFDREYMDAFLHMRKHPKLALGALGEWTTGKTVQIIGEWLRRWDMLAEVIMVGCDAFDDPLQPDECYADCVSKACPSELNADSTDYRKSVEMLGLCLQGYVQYFRPLRWYHRELREAREKAAV